MNDLTLTNDEYYYFSKENLPSDTSTDIYLINQCLYMGCLFTTGFFLIEQNRNIKEMLIWLFLMFQQKINRLFKNLFFSYSKSDSGSESDSLVKKQEVKYEEKYKDKYVLLENNELSEQRLEELKYAIVMETTPIGNVILFYDKSRNTFTYYSDNTIPYRFLETVARKYVVIHNCKSIFVDMDEQIKNAQNKLDEKKRKLEEDNERKKQEAILNPNAQVPVKKNVFAKLKSYNKDSGLKAAGISGEAKHSSSKRSTTENEDTMILKEKANRYSCEGKIANFSFLKKVDRKIVDKRYAMSFSEFKKMQNMS
jgi:hypothetical protein